jgi:putative spermidine/putrescine transport system substrate-binding protein
MIKRRKFLYLSGLALVGTAGCSLFSDPNRLRILGLVGVIPSKLLSNFEKETSRPAELKTENTPQKIWLELQKNSGANDREKLPHVISLGDSWLWSAVKQNYLQPLPPKLLAQVPQWQFLDRRWQKLAMADSSSPETVWGIPYRWGSTVITYRSDKLEKFTDSRLKNPLAWADLWRPELRGKLVLPDDAREVIGLVLKKQGFSYNSPLPKGPQREKLVKDLQQLHQQVLFYSSEHGLQAMLSDDAWVTVTWSNDAHRVLRQYPNVKAVVPQEGTSLWADLWVLPKGADANPDGNYLNVASQWMNFCLGDQAAMQLAALGDAMPTSSRILSQLPDRLKQDPLKVMPSAIWDQSEILYPLSPEITAEYQQLWQQIRQG